MKITQVNGWDKLGTAVKQIPNFSQSARCI